MINLIDRGIEKYGQFRQFERAEEIPAGWHLIAILNNQKVEEGKTGQTAELPYDGYSSSQTVNRELYASYVVTRPLYLAGKPRKDALVDMEKALTEKNSECYDLKEKLGKAEKLGDKQRKQLDENAEEIERLRKGQEDLFNRERKAQKDYGKIEKHLGKVREEIGNKRYNEIVGVEENAG